MRFTIRPMERGDVPTVTAIDRLSFPTPWPARAFLHELRQGRSRYYVLLRPAADKNGASQRGWRRWVRRTLGFGQKSRVIGYVGFRVRRSEAHITTLAVHPDWRGKGLGELLLLSAMRKMLREGTSRATLEMRPSNDVARQLYDKYGFQLTDTHRGYYRDGEDAWLMAADLDGDAYQAQLRELRQALEDRLCRQQIEVGQTNPDTL